MSSTIRLGDGYLTTDIQLACKTDRAAHWEPMVNVGTATEADPRIISFIGKTAAEAEAKVRSLLVELGEI